MGGARGSVDRKPEFFLLWAAFSLIYETVSWLKKLLWTIKLLRKKTCFKSTKKTFKTFYFFFQWKTFLSTPWVWMPFSVFLIWNVAHNHSPPRYLLIYLFQLSFWWQITAFCQYGKIKMLMIILKFVENNWHSLNYLLLFPFFGCTIFNWSIELFLFRGEGAFRVCQMKWRLLRN